MNGLTEEQMQRWIELQIALENFRSDIEVAKSKQETNLWLMHEQLTSERCRERTTLVKYSAVALADDPPGLLGA